jgi:hypothetical protein
VQAKHIERADQIRESLSRRSDAIRAKTHWSTDAKNGALARAHADAEAKMAELQQTAAGETAADRLAAHRRAFAGPIPGVDPGSLVVSNRDAADRAERLTSPADAAAMLARAERSGDEPLARAVAAAAFDQVSAIGAIGDPGPWGQVVDDYAARRPGKADAINELAQLSGSSQLNARNLFAFVLPKPPEIAHLQHGQLQTLIANAPSAA